MKKLIAICASLLLISGCGDATTQVSNKNDVLVKVGDSEITKGDVYTGLVAQGDISPLNEAMNRFIVDKAVPVTEEIEKKAQETLAGYKESYGDEWEKKFKDAGYETEEDFYKNVVLLNARVAELPTVFVKDDFNNLAEKYKPRKAEIVAITDSTKVDAALKEAKDGTALSEIATKYGDTTTFNGSEEVYNSKSGLSDVLWNNIVSTEKDGKVIDKVLQDTNNSMFYIVKVTNVKPSKFKDEAMESIKSIQTSSDNQQAVTGVQGTSSDELSIADQAFVFFLDKYDFSIHDVDIYQVLLTSSNKYER